MGKTHNNPMAYPIDILCEAAYRLDHIICGVIATTFECIMIYDINIYLTKDWLALNVRDEIRRY